MGSRVQGPQGRAERLLTPDFLGGWAGTLGTLGRVWVAGPALLGSVTLDQLRPLWALPFQALQVVPGAEASTLLERRGNWAEFFFVFWKICFY